MKNKTLLIALAIFTWTSCRNDKVAPPDESGYPLEISKIMVKKCATAGCHNSESRGNAGGLDYSSWNLMFEGGRNGTTVIPYSTAFSSMLYFVNTDSLKGPVALPTMPYLQTPLSAAEYATLKDWIEKGAPDKNGFVKFSDNPNRKKVYITMQGCDVVGVMDAETKVIMRYIPVGVDPSIEGPHQVRISPDGKYWYVVFITGGYLQKFRTSDDSRIGEADIGFADWNTIAFSPDSKTGYVSAVGAKQTAVVDLETMTHTSTISAPAYGSPHAGFVTSDNHYLYLSNQVGNFLTKVDLTTAPFYNSDDVILQPGELRSNNASYNPHEFGLSPDSSKYFVSCQLSNEVRVFNLTNDSLLAVIPVGTKPQEFSVSHSTPYIFVTCTEDVLDAHRKGSVYIINYQTLQVVGSVYPGYQPHGISVDDDHHCVYVANLNFDTSGPAPHHSTTCGGRNGYMSIIDLHTLQLFTQHLSDGSSFEYKNEVLPFPYFVEYRK